MIFRVRALAIAAAFGLALSACESATNSDEAPQGTLVFTFSGDTAGTYDATGRFNRRRPDVGTFAVGAKGPVTGGEALAVYGHAARTGILARADDFLMTVESPQVGSVTCAVGNADCPFGGIFFVGAVAGGEADAIYTSVSGTVTITSINEDRARGTFTFQMEAFGVEEDPRTLQVTGGTFDVPIVQNVT
ncbi:MAG TPA: hypothetical protein VLK84_31515 [Longimicrobium sp.]|nr:hypothetical protein [Longimicrobium sp.]